jgi:peroxiredoxin
MKKIKIFVALAISAILFAFTLGEEKDIAIGTKAPKVDMKMTSINDKPVSLMDVKQDNGLLVIFSCNTCPFVIGWEDRYNDLAKWCADNKVGMAVINSNEAKRDGVDSKDEMKVHATDKAYMFPYLVDTNSELAKAFGATVTPQAYLFDSDAKLAYKGLIDDNMRNRAEATPHLANAMQAMVKGDKISVAKTNAQGCSIKKVKL